MSDTLGKQRKLFSYKDFNCLDKSSDLNYLINASHMTGNLPSFQNIKKRAINQLNLKSGDSVLEIGCGIGKDTALLSELVGLQGQVIAVDNSQAMLDYASEHNAQPNVLFQLADANKLNFSDNHFDAVYMDRLLISQKNVDLVLEEAIRVLKPGGHIVTTDLDFGTIFLYPYHERLTHILINRLCNIVENKFIGRALCAYFIKHKLNVNAIIPEAYALNDFKQTIMMVDFPRMIEDLVELGEINEEEARTLLYSFEHADNNNTFLYGLTLFTAAGKKI